MARLRYILYMVSSVLVIIVPPLLLWYSIWLEHQPRVGPVGNGPSPPSDHVIVSVAMSSLTGIINLPIAIMRYREYRRRDMFEQPVRSTDEE